MIREVGEHRSVTEETGSEAGTGGLYRTPQREWQRQAQVMRLAVLAGWPSPLATEKNAIKYRPAL